PTPPFLVPARQTPFVLAPGGDTGLLRADDAVPVTHFEAQLRLGREVALDHGQTDRSELPVHGHRAQRAHRPLRAADLGEHIGTGVRGDVPGSVEVGEGQTAGRLA